MRITLFHLGYFLGRCFRQAKRWTCRTRESLRQWWVAYNLPAAKSRRHERNVRWAGNAGAFCGTASRYTVDGLVYIGKACLGLLGLIIFLIWADSFRQREKITRLPPFKF